MIDVKEAGMVGEPEATAESETEILQAILDHAKDHAVIYFPKGTYNLNTVRVAGKTLSLVSDGNALIVQHADAPVFDFVGGWESRLNVSAVLPEEVDLTTGNNQTTRVNVLVLDGNAREAGYRSGDLVKIYGDDPIPGAKPGERQGTARRIGEFARALRVEGNRIVLNRELRENYRTRVRLARLDGRTFRLHGLSFDTLDRGDGDGWSESYISIRACPGLRLSELSCARGWGSFIKLVGCFAYRLDNITAQNLKNMASQGIYGYGINDFSSDGGVVRGGLFVNCRHGYTTNTAALPEDDDRIEYYGRTANIIVADSHGYACSNAAFDTHDEAWNIAFHHCVAQGSYRGNNALGVGFSARGRHIRFDHCTSVKCNVGFASTEAYPDSSSDHVFVHCTAIGSTHLAAEMKRIGSGLRVRRVHFGHCRLESDGEYVVNFRHSDIDLKDTSIRSLNATDASSKLMNIESSALNINECRLIFDAPRPDDTPRIFRIVGESSVCARHIRVRHPHHVIERIAESPSPNNSSLLMEDVEFRLLPSRPPHNIANYRIGAVGRESGATTAHIVLPAEAGNANPLDALRRSADPFVVADLIPAANLNIAVIPAGYKPMQRLVVRNRAAAGNPSVTLRVEGLTVRLLRNESLHLVWNGREWLRTG